MRMSTESLIADTFVDMLEKEDLDKITVKRLIGECHISRQTFYYHFHDIMDVLEWSFKKATQELVENSLNAGSQKEALSFFSAFVKMHRTKLDRLRYSRNWIRIEGLLTDSAMTYLGEIARRKAPDIDISYEDMEITLRFYASGFVGVLLQYCGKKRINEEKMVRQLDKLISGEIWGSRHYEKEVIRK